MSRLDAVGELCQLLADFDFVSQVAKTLRASLELPDKEDELVV